MKPSTSRRLTVAGIAVALCAAGGFALYLQGQAPPPVALGPPPALSVMAAGKDVRSEPQPLSPKAAPTVQTGHAPTVALRDADYRRLVAAKSSDAYPMAEVCLRENAVATGPYHVNPVLSRCALEQGTWQDRQLRKEAIRAYALAARFGGVHNLWEERPGSDYGAFSDDPEGYQKLMDEAERVGIERGEPVALGGASIMLRALADALATKGDSAQAHDAYMESLAMAVGSAAGHAQYNAALAAGTRIKVAPYDPANDPKVASYPLSDADRLAAINDGLRRADTWRKQS